MEILSQQMSGRSHKTVAISNVQRECLGEERISERLLKAN